MPRLVVGIDLGTSNCAMATVDPSAGAGAPVRDVPVDQLVRPGEVEGRPLLPSVVYLPADGQFPPGALELPWGAAPVVTGELARATGAQVPGRVITSAKSWLINTRVDRQAAILPWGAGPDVARRSPVSALSELLAHLARAFHHRLGSPLTGHDVVITIPASFDESARALTLQAARDAGFELDAVSLLEEPTAAFYDFTGRNRGRLADALEGLRLVLVVDVGGGTTDFSLVAVSLRPEGPALERIAVGDHLLLGGDNMDVALARHLEAALAGEGKRLGAREWSQAVLLAREAKERLLGDAPPARHRVTLAAAGARLVGRTLSTELDRAEVEALVVDGFFPPVSQADAVVQPARSGVVALGLPYAQDPAITRHLVEFLGAHRDAGWTALGTPADGLPRPDAILLNGGVFSSPALSRALVERVSALWPSAPPVPLLPHGSLDLAVARGAAYSGLARRQLGQRIRGGAPRAFYVAVSSGEPRQGVCVVPRGLDEGSTVELTARPFTLTLGRPVQFQLSSTTADRLDRPGDIVELERGVFEPLPPIHALLEGAAGSTVQVTLVAHLSEVGTLALSLVAGERRWRLEFEVRGSSRAEPVAVVAAMPARFGQAATEIERVFGVKPLPVQPRDVKTLFRTLEGILGPREGWTVPVLRELWTAVYAGVKRRRRSADHERLMYQLLGFTLRPGVGYPLDGWRCAQTFSLFKEPVTFHGEQPVWAEYWILWRRIAGGLTEAAQRELWAFLAPHLARRIPPGTPPAALKAKGVQPQALEEMVRCAASLELVDEAAKEELGGWVLSRLQDPATAGGPWAWALGRLGARVPLHTSGHRVVDPAVAARWIDALVALDARRHDGAPFAVTQLARRTRDHAVDIDEDTRAKALGYLRSVNAPQGWLTLVEEAVALSVADEARALGDTLPAGLAL